MINRSTFILALTENWWSKRQSIINLLLIPWSILFLSFVFMRRWCYRLGFKKTTTFDVPVVIVGNIVVGGTGKTPVVIYLANLLKRHGYNPGIVSRGYGVNRVLEPIAVLPHHSPAEVGDEPVLIASRTNCPVVISVDRVAAVKFLLDQYHCDIVLSDDGMQHYALGRDVEIVVVDGIRRFGNGFCLPAGPLREPLSRLNTVDWIVCNGRSLSKTFPFLDKTILMNLLPKQITSVNDSSQQADTDQFKNIQIHAVAGIGHPKRFFDTLRELGLQIIEHPFPDHYRFLRKDIDFGAESKVIMTEKDAVKCREFADSRHYFIPVEAEFSEGFDQKFLDKISKIKVLKS